MREPIPEGLIEKSPHVFIRFFRHLKANWPRSYGIQIAGFFLLLLLNIAFLNTPLLQRFDNIFYDAFLRCRPQTKIHPAIVYIGIDEKSIKNVHHFPWPRHYHAVLAQILKEWKAKAIVFDVLFSEPSDHYGDKALEEVFATLPNLYLPSSFESLKQGYGLEQSIEPFRRYSKAKTHVNYNLDPDGIMRRIPPYLSTGTAVYPHLGIQVAFDYLGKPMPGPSSWNMPLDLQGRFLIPWTGKWAQGFPYYSYVDILTSYLMHSKGKKTAIGPEMIKDKICIIGFTASGYTDIKPSPIEPQCPGVAAIAQVANSILTNQFITPASRLTNAGCLIGIVIMALFIFIPFRNLISFAGGLIFGVFWIALAFGIFSFTGLWLSVIHPLVLIACLFIFASIHAKLAADREKEHFFKLSSRDGLTGLFVIRHFRDVLNETVVYSRAMKRSFAIILIDIDNFKEINDTHGHLAGDAVLKQLSNMILTSIRLNRRKQEDLTARYGGEEFIVLLPDTNLSEAALRVAERIRKSIEKAPLVWEHRSIPVTVSLGIATLRPEDERGDDVISRADEALYRAKAEGKNRSCVEKLGAASEPL